jgi:hypothetical protein
MKELVDIQKEDILKVQNSYKVSEKCLESIDNMQLDQK